VRPEWPWMCGPLPRGERDVWVGWWVAQSSYTVENILLNWGICIDSTAYAPGVSVIPALSGFTPRCVYVHVGGGNNNNNSVCHHPQGNNNSVSNLSNWAYCNQTSEHQTHYTNSQQFETVLNYRIIAIDYVKWEKFVSCFRWRIHQPISKYIVTKTFVYQQFVNTNWNTWNVKMRRIWWHSVCIGRYQQNILNKFRYPYIELVVCLIFPIDVSIFTDKLTD